MVLLKHSKCVDNIQILTYKYSGLRVGVAHFVLVGGCYNDKYLLFLDIVYIILVIPI